MITFEQDKKKIRHCFNRAMLTYDDNCNLQIKIGSRLINLLEKHKKEVFRSVVDVGCGTGIVTKQLAYSLKYQNFTAVDIADKLLKTADKRLSDLNVQILEVDFDQMPFEKNSVSLVFSNMSLQWSFGFYQTIKKIKRILKSEGLFVFSIPIDGTFDELKKAQAKVNASNKANHFLKEKELLNILNKLQFCVLDFQINEYVECFSDIFLLLKSIKQYGLKIKGWVANCVDDQMLVLEENISTLKQKLESPCLGVIYHHALPEAVIDLNCFF